MDIEFQHVEVRGHLDSGPVITAVVSDESWLTASFKERAHSSSVADYFDLGSPSSLDASENPDAEPASPVEDREVPLQPSSERAGSVG